MRISIAMATYNGAKYLQEQLDSFLQQTRLPDELVVCDDDSADGTIKILEAFRQKAPFAVNIYKNDKNLGHIRNFEKALSLCSGDLIFISDQDDLWDKRKISVVFDCFNKNPRIDVVVNDAYYTDGDLNRTGATVLQKVISVTGDKSFHIAGACTTITKRFLNFIVPFPKGSCPQHDIYIHRWERFIGNKLVLDMPLQVWRIHGNNTTNNNEMSDPEIVSTLRRFLRAKNFDSTNFYLREADEYSAMHQVIDDRTEYLLCLPMAPKIDDLRLNLNQCIDAKINRSKLMNLSWFERKKLILQMMVKGQYKYFYGLKSFAKDLLR